MSIDMRNDVARLNGRWAVVSALVVHTNGCAEGLARAWIVGRPPSRLIVSLDDPGWWGDASGNGGRRTHNAIAPPPEGPEENAPLPLCRLGHPERRRGNASNGGDLTRLNVHNTRYLLMCFNANINISVDASVAIGTTIRLVPVAGSENPGQATVNLDSQQNDNATEAGEPVVIDLSNDTESEQSVSSDQGSDTTGAGEPIVIDLTSDTECNRDRSESSVHDAVQTDQQIGSDIDCPPWEWCESRPQSWRESCLPADTAGGETLPYVPIRIVLEELDALRPDVNALLHERAFMQYHFYDLGTAAAGLHQEFMEQEFGMREDDVPIFLNHILTMWQHALEGEIPEVSNTEN
ncbi:hypothetical protein BD779DRAFT_1469001 [Infundibulicybe gibba]|nr:hypothetical protein BD779DRAFT_1469001 [Infundibulicybe gibba]